MKMLVGDRSRFAIEAVPEQFVDDWILGRFRFWIGGTPVGDWEDATDLKGCVRWLRDFESTHRDRFDLKLEGLSASNVFELVWEPVYGANAITTPAEQPVPNAFARFHINHLGMSSFEKFDLILVETKLGTERLLWRNVGESHINEYVFAIGEMEDIARRFCEEFESAYLVASK